MPPPSTDPRTASPEMVTLARQLYVDGVKVSDILARTGFSRGMLYFWIDGGGQDGGLTPIPRRHKVLRKRRRLTGDRVSVVARLWRTAEQQVHDIEERLALDRQEPSDRERDARMLAVLVKTLRELCAFDETNPMRTDAEDDDPVPEDIEEFRAELARRIEAFVAAETGEPVCSDPVEELG